MRINKTMRGLLIRAFKHGEIMVSSPMLSLTHRQGVARLKLLSLGLLRQDKAWVTEEGNFVTINSLTKLGHDMVCDMIVTSIRRIPANVPAAFMMPLLDIIDNYLVREKDNGKDKKRERDRFDGGNAKGASASDN